ncbi:cAMP-dependent protein kinase catalytic subunit 1-like [Planococcus citri]|uniref:cAMP-dependent protein kinase catalytic subunit 1-like n=1 Tax=Planococcus citri TaxID=170843 RepID=UPI0031FA359D
MVVKGGKAAKKGAPPAKKAPQAKAKAPPSMKDFLLKAKKAFDFKWKENRRNTAKLSDFEIIRTLGTGQFGRVLFVRHLRSKVKQFYAMKILERQKVVSMMQTEHVIYEKKVLQSIDFPFLVNYRYHFKDNAALYFVLEFIPGGEMFTNLQKVGKYPEPQSRFYAAQVVLSFEYLHFLGIVYRDLKPENLLIDGAGYLKITDFGFAKRIDDKQTMTMCGTPEYLAPEVIKNVGYSYSVDWWALGILIYEMCNGKPPFASEEPMKIFEKIMNARVKYPNTFNPILKDVCKNLLIPDFTKRLGTTKDGTNAVKMHEWFKSVDWMKLFDRKLPAPYIPEIKSIEDTSNFEEYDEQPILELPEEVYSEEFKDF